MKLKICGMKYAENIKEIASLCPDYIGFIFHRKSPRFIGKLIIPEIPKKIKKVGVFVNSKIEFIRNSVSNHSLEAVQLHGHESVEICKKLKDLPVVVIKAFQIDNNFNFNMLTDYETCVDFFLFDCKGPLPGGNGTSFDWDVLDQYNLSIPYFLSGGIGNEDLEIIKSFKNSKAAKRCFGLDINSKFELWAGKKNYLTIKKFIQNYDL